MSSTSPDDLQVTFRSLERRLHEAQGDAPHEVTAGPHGEVGALLGEAGRLLGVTADPIAIADAIHAVPADEWDVAVLDRLRELALQLGALVRQISRAAGTD